MTVEEAIDWVRQRRRELGLTAPEIADRVSGWYATLSTRTA